MHVVCLILEYFPRDTSPPPQKKNNEVKPEHFCFLLNNTEGWRGGVTMVPNSQGGSPASKKVQKILHTFGPRLQFTVNSLQEYQKLTNLSSSDFL